jgi:hypothetical protein
MRKRVISVPATVTVEVADPTGKAVLRELPFSELMETFLLRDQQWGKSLDAIEANLSVRKKVSEMNGSLALEREEWEILASVTRNPTVPYNPQVATQLVTYLRAIVEAPWQED